jgi:DinB superfamily
VHPRLQELIEYVEAQRATLLSAVTAVPESVRDRRPTPQSWSVAEVLEHLHLVEQGVARLISRKLEKARTAGLGQEAETRSVLRSLDRFALLDRRTSMPAPEFVQPGGTLSAAAAVAALAESRRTLRDALAAGDGLALDGISAPHVLLGPLTLYQWVLFVGQHEHRHALQIRDIAQQLTAA